jgi:hypothetical protein
MVDFLVATTYALVLSTSITIAMGFVYYMMAVAMMNVSRRIWGEGHRGHLFLNLAVVALVATFLLLFSFFARLF